LLKTEKNAKKKAVKMLKEEQEEDIEVIVARFKAMVINATRSYKYLRMRRRKKSWKKL
jgi:hypothetical protein